MLSLEDQVGQMLAVGFNGVEPPAYLLDWLASGRVGSVILFGRNVATPGQLAEMTEALHAAAKYPLLIAIDQEGGTVARLRDGFTESPGALALGVADSAGLAEWVSGVLAAELHAMGINWNLAPVVDVTHDIGNASVGTRSLGSDPKRVAALVQAEVRGFQQEGVAATAKHFPGLGNTPVDTHRALAVIDHDPAYLWANDLVPFCAAIEAGVATVMTTHVKFTALDAKHPATLSRQVIQTMLREAAGFQGLVCSDCMEMRAIADHYGPAAATVLAAQAGQDVILFSHTRAMQEEAHDALLAAVRSGQVTMARVEEATRRVAAVKQAFAWDGTPQVNLIQHPEHVATMRDAARRGVVVLRVEAGVLPLSPDQERRVGLVEFASVLDSEIVESGDEAGLVVPLRARLPNVPAVVLPAGDYPAAIAARARQLAEEVDLLLLATRNAHLTPPQQALAQTLIGRAPQTVLLCLRNPYDAGVLRGAGSILCTCGDSTPSLEAAVDALLGDFAPARRLPVPVELAE